MKLILLCHGQSLWNLENKFTGWTDVDLSDQGIKEAHRAGKLLKSEGYSIDAAYTFLLRRAIRTLRLFSVYPKTNFTSCQHSGPIT